MPSPRVELSPGGASCEPNHRFYGPGMEGWEAALDSCFWRWRQTLTYDSKYGAAGGPRCEPGHFSRDFWRFDTVPPTEPPYSASRIQYQRSLGGIYRPMGAQALSTPSF